MCPDIDARAFESEYYLCNQLCRLPVYDLKIPFARLFYKRVYMGPAAIHLRFSRSCRLLPPLGVRNEWLLLNLQRPVETRHVSASRLAQASLKH
jgi:hypothetical protein